MPVEGHIGGGVLVGVDDEIGGAGSVHSGLKMMRVTSPSKSNKHAFCP